uniref:Uncharacterized protein n=1 Tax=Catharus ustulatus TaxID=91951 RepID=A0A8C3U327_CATUS
MRSANNQCHLLTPNRPKITDRILLCQPHRTGCSRNHDSNSMGLLRSNNSNNLTWPYLLNAILPSQHQLRTYSQPNPHPSPRPPTTTASHGHLMTPS